MLLGGLRDCVEDSPETAAVLDDFKKGFVTLMFYFGAFCCSSVPIKRGSSIVRKLHVVESRSRFNGVTLIYFSSKFGLDVLIASFFG